MIKKESFWVLLVLAHLSTVNLFIWTGIEDKGSSVLHRLMRIYRDFSGCFRDYTYFAPNVANDTRAGFFLKNERGEVGFLPFRAENELINTRYNNIISSSMRNIRARDLFARSWATAMFGREEGTKEVTVVAEAYFVPTMKEYREGARPAWEIIYAGTFEKRKDGVKALEKK